MTHDFEAALSDFESTDQNPHNFSGKQYREWRDDMRELFLDVHEETIIFALKLAHKVTQEPSEGMVDEADIENMQWAPCADYDVIFKAMIKKACEEVECEQAKESV